MSCGRGQARPIRFLSSACLERYAYLQQSSIERGSWSALLARCCLLAGYCGLVEKREEDAIFAHCLGEELLMS